MSEQQQSVNFGQYVRDIKGGWIIEEREANAGEKMTKFYVVTTPGPARRVYPQGELNLGHFAPNRSDQLSAIAFYTNFIDVLEEFNGSHSDLGEAVRGALRTA